MAPKKSGSRTSISICDLALSRVAQLGWQTSGHLSMISLLGAGAGNGSLELTSQSSASRALETGPREAGALTVV